MKTLRILLFLVLFWPGKVEVLIVLLIIASLFILRGELFHIGKIKTLIINIFQTEKKKKIFIILLILASLFFFHCEQRYVGTYSRSNEYGLEIITLNKDHSFKQVFYGSSYIDSTEGTWQIAAWNIKSYRIIKFDALLDIPNPIFNPDTADWKRLTCITEYDYDFLGGCLVEFDETPELNLCKHKGTVPRPNVRKAK